MTYDPTKKMRGQEKMARVPIKIAPTTTPHPKPEWLRVKAPATTQVAELRTLLRQHQLVTVCEEASCPNLSECFGKGTATFMIMGDKCTRRCTFCDVAHGRPDKLDSQEPQRLATTIAALKLQYVVITSVDRDDLRDGGAHHFTECITAIRSAIPTITIEILVPDFRGRMIKALPILAATPPDVFNHNLETVPRLYKQARPGSDYQASLDLIKNFKAQVPTVPTKSGLMLGLGETDEELYQVLCDLRAHGCDRLTLGQYLQPSPFHHPVERYVTPEKFFELGLQAEALGFEHVASGPLVRSSYHADLQAEGKRIS